MQSAGDVRLALEEVDGNANSSVERRPSRAAWSCSLAPPWSSPPALALFSRTASGRRILSRQQRFVPTWPVSDQAPLWFEEGNSLAMSRDGRTIAWVGGTGSARRLWVRPVDQLDARALTGTEEASSPFFPRTVSGSVFSHRLR